jgi:hypothetical protein
MRFNPFSSTSRIRLPHLACALLLTSLTSLTPGCKQSDEPKPVELTDPKLARIEGRISFDSDYMTARVYNGTNRMLTDIDVIIRNSTNSESRRFRMVFIPGEIDDKTLRPYSTGTFRAASDSFIFNVPDKYLSWELISARGYLE